MSRPARALLANLALSLASLVVTLLALEAAVRLFGLAPERELTWRRLVDARWTRLLDCYPSNPRGYFEIDLRRPESRLQYLPIAPRRFDAIAAEDPWAVESSYNHLRFRDLPPTPKRAGVRRVVVFGDSFTEGQGVKEGDTLARVLERRLEASQPGRWEVRNCGQRALDFPELWTSFETSLQYEPDLLVYALVLNDAVRPPAFQARRQYVDDWILDRVRPSDAVSQRGPRSLALELVRERLASWRVGRETTRWYLEMWSDVNPGWPRTQEYIREMDRRLRGRQARLLVAVWPLFVGLESGYPFEPAHRTIGAFLARNGIASFDMLPVFRGRRTADLWVHPSDHHPNEIANRLAAEALAPVVLRSAD